MKRLFISIGIICLGIISDANGQFYTDSWTLGPNWAYSRAMNDIETARLARQGGINGRLAREARTGSAAKAKIATGVTAFKADQPFILPKEIADSSNGSVEEKKQLQEALEQAIRAFQIRALKHGYPANDLAFALTYFFYNNYAIYHGIRPMWRNSKGQMQYNVSRRPIYAGQVKGVYTQFFKLLTAQEGIRKLSDSDKQKINEYLAISTTIFYESYAEVEPKLDNDMNEVAQIKETAKTNIESLLGRPIDKIKLGDDGISVSK